MKKYRCVFGFTNGNTTIEVVAADAEHALKQAKETVREPGATVEVWDETGLVLQRRTTSTASTLPQN